MRDPNVFPYRTALRAPTVRRPAVAEVTADSERFHFFWGGVFSNWYVRNFVVDGLTYDCNEQFMMAEKARLFGDGKTAERIMNARTPKEQKSLGRLVAGFDEEVWISRRIDIVAEGALCKFTQHEDLAEAILATDGRTLVEASPYDRIWGIGLSERDPRAMDRSRWLGLNLLGRLLIERVRPAVAAARSERPAPDPLSFG